MVITPSNGLLMGLRRAQANTQPPLLNRASLSFGSFHIVPLVARNPSKASSLNTSSRRYRSLLQRSFCQEHNRFLKSFLGSSHANQLTSRPASRLLLRETSCSDFHSSSGTGVKVPLKTLAERASKSEPSAPSKPPLAKRENIYTFPNLLTSTRILLCPLLAYTIINEHHFISSVTLFYCGLSDWLDGRLARKYPKQMSSVLGTILDPAADKILMTTLVISLGWKELLPLPLAILIVGRDMLLALSALYFRYQSLPPPKTFNRFWDFSLPSAEVKPTQISKYNTFLQLSLVGLTTVAPIVPLDISTPLSILQWTVAFTTFTSGLSYVFSKDAIRYIK
ncbi:hypothetical protein CROQUDRAFT_659471 [Cronartium quercuum f. sp. fusiforme G11]|uniref:Cardiolipin synthase n=1 Tax=Cronartium quercuum f. sp. fusiforme G11 TaxID=708437 RepID=A0A9P6NJQ4_9BASI|nr:hypothetical protein CROQUDRAFT_659471 [Cronartium quercuum f. sp. fusiforme G11]